MVGCGVRGECWVKKGKKMIKMQRNYGLLNIQERKYMKGKEREEEREEMVSLLEGGEKCLTAGTDGGKMMARVRKGKNVVLEEEECRVKGEGKISCRRH